MAVTLLFLNTPTTIDTLALDASLSETHTAKNTVTMHPVEQGVKITDHKLREPDGLVIQGIVTNDPLPANGAASQRDTTRAGQAYQKLLELLDSPNLLAVVTAIRSYDNMVLTDLSVPRDSKSGQALMFTATFTQIRVVQNQIAVVAKTTRATGNKDLHKKVPPAAPAAAKRKSFLKFTTDAAAGVHPLDAAVQGFKTFANGGVPQTGKAGF